MNAYTAPFRGGVHLLCNFRVRQEIGALSSRVGLQPQAGLRFEPQPLLAEFMATKSNKKRQEWKSVQPEATRAAAESPGDAYLDTIPELKKPEGLAKVETGKPVGTVKAAGSPAAAKQSGHVSSSPRSVWIAKSPRSVQAPAKAVQTPAVSQKMAPPTTIADKGIRGETDKQAPKAAESKSTAVAQAKMRATFYPKFENEKSDQEVRSRIIEMVSAGYGVLEVSLKHSGSLFMYSGVKGGAYAKNSYGNLYTATGVFVLGRTLQEAWGAEAGKKQQEFNKFLEDNRICVAMELVTAVLGDHGQRPLKDYVVVTAVTDLSGQPRFYPTPEVVAFCRQWRLPSNHFWLFSSKKSVTAFFTAYDALCEEGLASTVTHTLDEISDVSVPATKSHQEVQGEILEGLVARIISPESSVYMTSTIKQLPFSLPHSEAVGLGLREICAANRSSEKEQMKAIISAVGSDFCPDLSEWLGEDTVTVQAVKKADTPVLSTFLQAIPADNVTAKVQEMIRLLRKKNMHVRFKCRLHPAQKEVTGQGGFRLTVHVLADSVFRRYQNEMKNQPHLWPLYRGFFLDVTFLGSDSTKSHAGHDGNLMATEVVEGLGIREVEQTGSAENLMLKLKFLPYKLRTFLIRNGLSTLYTSGQAAYREYYMKQMKNWGTSLEKRRDLDQLLNEWAVYITTKTKGKQLNSDTYLSEAEPFLERFAGRSARNQQLVGSAGTMINVEDFLAGERSLDRDSHMEFEELAENGPPPSASIEPAESVKAKGLLVFFPGIPGCAKSALCKHVLSLPNGLGDGRKVATLMGDLIKGRYWQRLAADQKKYPSVIMLADKNAPNEEVWKQIETICQTTRALGVPVVSESDGTSSNPYSMDDLVIFIYRVLQRVNHPGNLDKNSPTPGYVLLMFYNLYEGTDRKEFEATLQRQYGHLVKVPLLKKDRAPMPKDILQVLGDGFSLFKRHKTKHGKADALQGSFKNEWVAWEKQLKHVLFAHSAYLDAIQVPFQEVASSLVGQLKDIANGDNYMHVSVAEEERNFNNVTYVAISLPQQEVLAALKDVAKVNSQFQEYVADKSVEKSVRTTHVTLAHKRAHGVAAVASYGELRGAKVPVQLTAVLFSEKLCAFEAQWESAPDQAVSSRNSWPHVTLWTDKGTAAKEANSLPRLVEAGEANRFVLQTPKTVVGEVQLL